MICGDDELEHRARKAMNLTKQMKLSAFADELDALSDDVHAAVDEFARYAGLAPAS